MFGAINPCPERNLTCGIRIFLYYKRKDLRDDSVPYFFKPLAFSYMNNETHQISEVLPVDDDLFGGEISLEGDFSLTHTHQSKAGDLFRTGFEMVSEFGHADCMMLGKRHYFAISELYQYRRGLICTARLNQPMIQLHFQLGGSAQTHLMYSQEGRASTGLNLNINPGETNLLIVPSLNDSFELTDTADGNIFSIMFSIDYIRDLFSRYPVQMEPILTNIKKRELCLLKKQNVPITPRMRDVILRIQNQNHDEQMAGSLFLEAQILDLLSMFFIQMEQPEATSGRQLSRSDQDRIHRAREILLEQLDSPPTLAELSKRVGTNEFKLKRGFKEIFGTSPYAYHLQHKLEIARSFILDTELTISEIAYKVGYSDPAHLSNAFRRQYGISPSDLR